MVLVTMRPRPSRQVRQTRSEDHASGHYSNKIVRFLLEGGLRFRNLGFCGHNLMETANFNAYSPLRRGFPGPGPAHCAYPTRARTWTRPGASSRTVEHKDQLFAEPRLVVHSRCPAFGRVHSGCCHVRLPRPRPGHTLKRGELLGARRPR